MFKVTLCNNLTLFDILKFILIAYGHVKDRYTPVSSPLAIQDMPYVVLCSRLEHPAKMEEKLSQHDIASYTAKRHQLVCWQAYISANWSVDGVCKIFACLLGSFLVSFGTKLLIATLRLICIPFAYQALNN